MQLDVAIKYLNELLQFLQKYRLLGFKSALVTATELANELDVDCEFTDRRKRKKKRQFTYESEDEIQISPEKLFKTECFIPILDPAIISLKTRLEGYQEIASFGFLWNFKDL